MKNYFFHVGGMHCKACAGLIEAELEELAEVSGAIASLKNMSVEIEADFGDKTIEHVMADLNEVLKGHGYVLSTSRVKHAVSWADFNYAIPIAAAFIAFFIILQKLGIVNLVQASEVSYATAFIVGMIASVSTCMAIVGGLVLSVSANFAKEGYKVGPQMLFHAGRLVSFFFLGGVIGILGAGFDLGAGGTFILGIIVSLVLLILGINLLDIFPWFKKLQPSLPAFMGKHVQGVKNLNHTLMPLLLGVATFFLPCGFTQSMQLYALSSGSFWTGAMTMLVFALGTLPVLALLSFSSLSIHTKAGSGIFFKTAGLVVLFFGIFNLINSLVAYGIIAPVFNF